MLGTVLSSAGGTPEVFCLVGVELDPLHFVLCFFCCLVFCEMFYLVWADGPFRGLCCSFCIGVGTVCWIVTPWHTVLPSSVEVSILLYSVSLLWAYACVLNS